MPQQPNLSRDPAGIAGEFSAGSQNSVAGNDNGNGIAAHSSSNGLGSAGIAQHFRDLSVGYGVGVGDIHKNAPYLSLKVCAFRFQGKLGGAEKITGKIPVQPGGRHLEYRQTWVFCWIAVVPRKVLLTREPQSGETFPVRGEGQFSEWRVITAGMIHVFSFRTQKSGIRADTAFYSDYFLMNSTPRVPGPQWQETVQPASV